MLFGLLVLLQGVLVSFLLNGQEILSLFSHKTLSLEFLFSAGFHLCCKRFPKIQVKHCYGNLGLLIL